MLGKRLDLVIVILGAFLAILLNLSISSNAGIRIVVMLPLVLVLPGYAATEVLFPVAREDISPVSPCRSVGTCERILFTLGMSLAISALGGLILNLTPWGLTKQSWTVFLAVVSAACAGIALAREDENSRSSRSHDHVFTRQQVLILGLATLLVVAAMGIALSASDPRHYPGYTQLWMVPGFTHAKQHTVHIGVRNAGVSTNVYALELRVQQKIVRQWHSIALVPGTDWNVSVVVSDRTKAVPGLVEALLYRHDRPGIVLNRVYMHASSRTGS